MIQSSITNFKKSEIFAFFFQRYTAFMDVFWAIFSQKKKHCSQALCGRYMLESLLFQFFIPCSHDFFGQFFKNKNTFLLFPFWSKFLSKIKFLRLVCPCCHYFYSLKGFLLLFHVFLLSESAFSVQNCFVSIPPSLPYPTSYPSQHISALFFGITTAACFFPWFLDLKSVFL